jgi:hypothetical protein
MLKMKQRPRIYYSDAQKALNAVFLEPEVWVKTLGYKYEDTVQDVATGEFYTEKTRAEMLKKEPVRPVLSLQDAQRSNR